ncbi:AAA family ATPase [Paenibacillus elgii]|uniref:AAA family ATPase n=1 Tax=Paenibacillus elgii TaxID=189691 RepID=UPI0013D61A91|nr:hypothetical protein [Paenibacillus elgii]
MKLLFAHPQAGAADRLGSQLSRSGSDSDGIVTVQHRDRLFARLEETFDVVAVHTGLFYDSYPWDWMPEIRRKQPQARVVVAPDEAVYDSFMLEALTRLAETLGFAVLPLGGTEQETFEALAASVEGRSFLKAADDKRSGIVVAVWPASSKDGATTVAVNTALALASANRLRVGLIDANLRNPEIRSQLNLTETDRSQFKLRPKLQTHTLQPEDLLDSCITYRKMNGLHILTGSPRRDTALDMTPEMMAHLLQTARSVFDVTLVDLNAYPDNAATVCTVRGADIRWLVAQNNYASYRTSWREWFDCYWKYCGLTPSDVSLILNRASSDDKPERIADALHMSFGASIPNAPGGLGMKAVHEGVPLYLMPKAEPFTEAIDGLAALLTKRAEGDVQGAELAPGRRHKPGWISRLSALFG